MNKLFKRGKKEPASPAADVKDTSCEQVRAHQEAIMAGIGHMLRTVGDQQDPGVAVFACVITKSGEFIRFMHGALTFETAPTAASLLAAEVLNHTLAKRGKTSPMTQGCTGEEFVGGNEQYRKGVTK